MNRSTSKPTRTSTLQRIAAAVPWRNKTFLSISLIASVLLYIFLDINLRPNPNTSVLPEYDPPDSPNSPASSPSDQNGNPPPPPPKILLVSALFPLSKSKHSHSDYASWMTRFLGSITTDIYFFCPPDMEDTIRSLRGDLPITINTTFASPFDIPPLSDKRDAYGDMHRLDRERKIHSVELYAVWNAKAYFLDEAVKNLASHSTSTSGEAGEYDYAFWNDAGSFRQDHKYTAWPDPRRVSEVWEAGSRVSGVPKEDLLFFPMFYAPHPSMRFWKEGMGPVDNEFSEGSFFGGSPSTITWWRNTFYTYHDYYLSLSQFVGKDQTLINALFLLFPSRVISVWLSDPDAPENLLASSPTSSPPTNGTSTGTSSIASTTHHLLSGEGPLGACGPEWFYYQFFLSSPHERHEMRKIWDSEVRMWKWDWWRRRESCRLTRVVGVRGVLERWFGGSWRVPEASQVG